MKWFYLSAAMALAAITSGEAWSAEQGSATGLPLATYCNTVPDLSVKRTDAVDNWVAICTVWFNAKCNEVKAEQKPKAREKN